jgi:hypothetical protein
MPCKRFKGTLLWDFWPPVFHQTNPARPLTHRLKPFCIWLLIRRDIQLWNQFFGGQRCQWHRWPGLQIWNILTGSRFTLRKIQCQIRPRPNIFPQWTADQWWAVSMMPLTLAEWCQWHCWFNYANFVQKLNGVIDTADQWWAVSRHHWPVVGSVNDTADQWWVVSMTPLTGGGWCQWHRWPKLTPLSRAPQSLAFSGCF